MAQGKLLPRLTVDLHLDPARQVLSEVVNFFALGRRKILDDRQLLQAADRLVFLPDDRVKAVVKQPGWLQFGGGGGEILRFAVVNFRELHRTRRAEPAFVGAEPFLVPVGVGNAEHGQRGGGIAVVVGLRHKAELALVPAVGQCQRKAVRTLAQGHGVGLVLQALAVVRPAGVEIGIVGGFAVDFGFIHAQRRGVEPRFFHRAAYGKFFVQYRADGGILVKCTCNPLGFSLKRAAVQQTRLKAALGFGALAVVIPHSNSPCVPGARGQVGAEILVQNALLTLHRAGIPHDRPALHDL